MSSFISVQEHNRMIAELEAQVEQYKEIAKWDWVQQQERTIRELKADLYKAEDKAERIAELEAKVEDLMIRVKRWQHNENQIGTNAQVKRLQAEVERLRPDAERYRFMREGGYSYNNGFFSLEFYAGLDDDWDWEDKPFEEAIDAAIDAAKE